MRSLFAALLAALCILASCAPPAGGDPTGQPVQAPKYIFLFIGDGMGSAQAALLGDYRGTVEHGFTGTLSSPTPEDPPRAEMPVFFEFPVLGSVTTYDASKFVTDSAAAGTAIACGVKTLDGMLGQSPSGEALTSFAKELKAGGYRIGIVSSVALDHATPAAFYASVGHRSQYYEIGAQLPLSGFDYFGGGGFQSAGSEGEGQIPVLELAEASGYFIADTEEEILALDGQSGKTIAINPDLLEINMSFRYEIDRGEDGLRLCDFVRKGIDVMGTEDGFFLMCEGGMIDWAAHVNDAPTLLRELEEFEKAVRVALDFYAEHPEDTLILVTGDHETGGLSIGSNLGAYDTYLSLLDAQDVSFRTLSDLLPRWREGGTSFEEAMAYVKAHFGLCLPGDPDGGMLTINENELELLRDAYAVSMIPPAERTMDEAYRQLYSTVSSYEPFVLMVGRVLSGRAGVGWTTTLHTGTPVPIYAIGAGAEEFAGSMDNTDICKRILALCGAA